MPVKDPPSARNPATKNRFAPLGHLDDYEKQITSPQNQKQDSDHNFDVLRRREELRHLLGPSCDVSQQMAQPRRVPERPCGLLRHTSVAPGLDEPFPMARVQAESRVLAQTVTEVQLSRSSCALGHNGYCSGSGLQDAHRQAAYLTPALQLSNPSVFRGWVGASQLPGEG